MTKRDKRLRLFVSAAVFISSAFLSAASVYAEDGDEYIGFYQRNADILENNGFFASALRALLWFVTKGIVYIASACESLYEKAFGFIDFTSDSTVSSFIERFKPALIGIMALSLMYLGFVLIVNHEKKPALLTNICIFALCVCCSTVIFSELTELTMSFKSGLDSMGTTADKSEVYKIVDNNLIDLVDLGSLDTGRMKSLTRLDFEGRDESGVNYFNPGITKESFPRVDYTEVLNYETNKINWDNDSRRILKYRLMVISAGDGTYTTAENSNGLGFNSADDADIGNEFYFRYKFQFLIAWLQLAALIIIYITMSYKCVRIAFELVVARLLAYLYSAELSGGEKIKKIIVFIRDSYILLIVTAICIKVYVLITGYISSHMNNGLVSAIFSLFIAFAVIDGPNLVERLLGMDAGLKSSTARLLAAYGVAKGVTRAGVRTGGKAASKVFGEKTKKPMPADGKRHGGIVEKLNGKTDEKKGSEKTASKMSAASATAAAGGTPTGASGEAAPGAFSESTEPAVSSNDAANAAAGTEGASSVSAENAAPKDHSFMEGAEKKSDKPSFDVKDNKGRGRTHSFMEEKKSKNASGTMRRTVSGKSSYFASGQKNAGHDKDGAGKGIENGENNNDGKRRKQN